MKAAEKIHEGQVIEFDPNQITAFNEFESQLAELEKNNSKAVFDYEDPAGNKAARSHIYKLRQTKSAVEAARKEAKQRALEYGRAVDGQAKDISVKIEGMINVHLAPLQEIEDREKARVEQIKMRLNALSAYKDLEHDATALQIEDLLNITDSITVDDSFAEFQGAAQSEKDRAMESLKARLEERQRYEKEQEELDRLRREKAEREEKDRLDRIRQEAAEKARKEAEERAERQRVEAQERADREILEAKERAERAERDAKQAAEMAKADQEAAEKAKREEEERRAANKRHRASIESAAIEGLKSITGLDDLTAKQVVEDIGSGQIANVFIKY